MTNEERHAATINVVTNEKDAEERFSYLLKKSSGYWNKLTEEERCELFALGLALRNQGEKH